MGRHVIEETYNERELENRSVGEEGRSEQSLHWDAFKTWELDIGRALAERSSEPLKYRTPMGREIGLSIFGSKFHILYLQLSGVCQSRNTSLEGKRCPREQDLKESGSTNVSFQSSVLLCDRGAFPVEKPVENPFLNILKFYDVSWHESILIYFSEHWDELSQFGNSPFSSGK